MTTRLATWVGGALLAVSMVGAQAAGLTITAPFPINDLSTGNPVPACSGVGTGNDPDFIAASCSAMSGLTEFYKFDLPDPPKSSAESGTLANSYASTYNADASGGTISWTGPNAVSCSLTSSCWLLVKDGNQTPGRYAYNLTSLWDGVATITLTGFWPGPGGISHWALYAGSSGPVCTENCGPDRVPEPASVLLAGLALAGLGVARRRRSS